MTSDACQYTVRNAVQSFRSKALEQLFQGQPKLIEASLRRKVENILFTLSAAAEIEAMDLPGFHLHALTGKQTDRWSVRADKNWRITFRFEDGHAYDVDFEDYH